MTLKGLLDSRELAGSKYQNAINVMYEAYVQLASIDAALMNANINPGSSGVKTFSPLAADLRPFDHPAFAPLKLPCDWRETISARRDELINQFTPGVAA